MVLSKRTSARNTGGERRVPNKNTQEMAPVPACESKGYPSAEFSFPFIVSVYDTRDLSIISFIEGQ